MSTTVTVKTGTDRLPAQADVVVVGGGVIGLATAFQLAKRGVRNIVLLEQRHLGAGASGKSGALVRAHYTNTYEARLTHESIRIFKHWGDAVGYGDPRYTETGFLRVVSPEDDAKLWANVAALREDVGIDTWVAGPEEIKELEPLMRVDDILGAAFEPHAGYCDPNATVYGFAAAARALGVDIRTHVPVTGLRVEADRITAVETKHGAVSTRTVVLAAGAYSDRLLRPIGIDLGLIPWRSQVVIFRWPEEIDQRRKHRVVIDSTQKSWFRAEGEAGTLIGAEFGDRRTNPDTFNESLDIGYVEHARKALSARFPAFAHATMRGGFSGVYMQSPDFHPIIDRTPSVEGLWLMAGDAGSSFKTAPAIGICLAEWITEGAPKLCDLSPFRSTRFAEGKPWVDENGCNAGTEHTIAR